MLTQRMANEGVVAWAMRVNGSQNERQVRCIGHLDNGDTCGKIINKGMGYAVALPYAGINPRYLCEECRDRMLRYHGNACRARGGIGSEKKGSLENTTIGVELEYVNVLSGSAYLTLKVLIENNFNVIQESDCTVSGEFPTDYMHGANIISASLRKLDKYGFMPCFDNDRCGAHIHVYCENMDKIRNWYHTLFLPLFWYINSHSEEWIVENFGRDFGEWCEPIDKNSYAMEHSLFVNTQHNYTLEFRLPRIHSAKQYMNVVYFWRKVGFTLNNVKWITVTPNNRIARKLQAKQVAEEIVTIAKEYFGE